MVTSEFALDLWESVLPYLDKKIRPEIALCIVEVCEEHDIVDDLKKNVRADRYIKAAIKQSCSSYDDDEDDDVEELM